MDDLGAFCAKVNQHLTDHKGVVLPASWRLAVSDAARTALSCPGCAELGHDACLRPGSVYSILSKVDHQPPLFKDTGVECATDAGVVLSLVHSVIHHQSKAEKAWYQSTIQDLDGTSFIPASISETSRQALTYSLFCEIVGLTVLSHGINIAYIAMGRVPPSLPELKDVDDSALRPSMLDMSTLLKPGKTLRFEAAWGGWAPFVEFSDLDPVKLKEHFTEAEVSRLGIRLQKIVPFIGIGLSLSDYVLTDIFFDVFGYDQVKVGSFADLMSKFLLYLPRI